MSSEPENDKLADIHAFARCLLTADQVESCEKERADSSSEPLSIAEIALARGFLKEADMALLDSVLHERRGDAPSPQPKQKREPEIHDYFMQDRLGCGPLGTVYLASQLSVRRLVAIKALCPALFRDEQSRADLFNHARAVSALSHKNIVRILDCVRTQENTFIVSEYLRGMPLDVLVRRDGRFAEKRALGVALEITLALDQMRRAELCHRNIKPSNITITEAGPIKLTDFVDENVAAKPGRASMSWANALFMAPEQVSPRLLMDIRSDLYSLGLTIYYMMTGQVPFSGSLRDILNQKITQDIRSPRSVVPDLSEGSCKVIWGLTQREPRDRYQTPAEVLDDLRRASDSLGLGLASDDEQRLDLTQAQFNIPLLGENPVMVANGGGDLTVMATDRLVAPVAYSEKKGVINYPCRLRVIDGSDAGLIKIIMPGEELTIGRISGANLLGVRDTLVSRRHCVVRHTGEAVFLVDNGSTNGTFVNGDRVIEQVTLSDGARIQVGDTILVIEA
ncbi:MAG TPA: FHA domain-containing serine/threonine-protein kinase [Candidatus Brocadiia bacterium]|nr:FHA domain-containing serine/threonine-protein kinase [Candidatus Brocadiia bacterium]